jgi:hypothetical protein
MFNFQKRGKIFRPLALAIAPLMAAAMISWPSSGYAITLGKNAPDIAGENWINSRPLTIADLKGRVVLVEFWTYG